MKEKNKKKFDPRNLLLIVISIFFTLVILEIALRIILASNKEALVINYQDKEFLGPNKYWSVWHYPNNNVNHSSTCFSKTYETNSVGLKATEIDLAKPKIALLGDSYIEGYATSNSESLVHLMDSTFGYQYQFLPFASSGGFGPVHQYSIYENFAKFYEPEIVILFWLNYNDLYDNLKAIHDGLIDEKYNFHFPRSSSLDETLTEINNMGEPANIEFGLNSYVLRLAKRGMKFVGKIVQYKRNVKGNFKDALARVYSPEESERIKEGYEITEKTFSSLKASIERDSSKLIVINLFDPYQIDRNWLDAMGNKLGNPLKQDYPNKRIEEICKKLDIEYYSLLEETMKEIDKQQMTFPYFHHDCDNHLTKKGNLWLTKLVSQYLISQNHLSQ